ncbi:hypothetical protein SB717_34960, partial [Priestia sp. SIMBA_032]|uniref:hypothetical protein n=1 Tax=Priestia sp. SIMBA_032 TaxID=3085775 RepID=UPI00397C458C
IDGGPHKRWSMWFNSKQREEPYQMFPQKKQQTLYWIRELMGAVLIQAIHAITLWLVITLIGGAQNPIIKLILLAMFIPVGEIVKSFIGLSTNASAG